MNARSTCLSLVSASFLLAASAQAGTTTILENDPSITYTGTWYTNYETPNIGGMAYLTNFKGATATLSFTGTGITWIGVLDPYSGIAQLYLDGTPNTVDTYGPATLYQQPLFSVHGLAPGTHTLSIEVLHRRDGDTSGSWIWINAFDIEDGSGIVGGVSASAGHIEQNNPAISYTGNWYLNTNPIMTRAPVRPSPSPGRESAGSDTRTSGRESQRSRWTARRNRRLWIRMRVRKRCSRPSIRSAT